MIIIMVIIMIIIVVIIMAIIMILFMVMSSNNDRGVYMIMDRKGRAENATNSRSSTSLIRPRVMRESLRRHQVLAAAKGRVYITPLCSGTIHGLTVTLHHTSTVTEGQAGALTTTVDQGGGGLRLLHRQGGGGEDKGSQDCYLGQHDSYSSHFGRQDGYPM